MVTDNLSKKMEELSNICLLSTNSTFSFPLSSPLCILDGLHRRGVLVSQELKFNSEAFLESHILLREYTDGKEQANQKTGPEQYSALSLRAENINTNTLIQIHSFQ